MARYLAAFAAVSLSMLLPCSARAQTEDTETVVEAAAETETETAAPAQMTRMPAPAAPSNLSVVHPQASQAATAVSSRPAQKGIYYGNSILIADLAALGLGVLAVGSGSADAAAPLLLGAVATFAFGGPIIHEVHGNVGTGFGSLGLRLGLPVAGTFLGVLAGAELSRGCTTGDMCELGGVLMGGVLGFGAGAITASVIDISLLAYEDAPKGTSPRLALVPAIDPKRGSAGLSFQGAW